MLLSAGAGCAIASDNVASDEKPDSDDSELRSLRSGERVGSIACGETKRVRHSSSPTYRALALQAKRGQTLDIRVSAPGHDAIAWLTNASNGTLSRNDNEASNTRDARIVYVAKSSSTHHVVFREANYEDNVDFDVSLRCTGGAVDAGSDASSISNDPFNPASCDGLPITLPDAITKIGAGNASAEVSPAQLLQARQRSCNETSGCSAWGPPAPVAHAYYMASGNDNRYVPRQYNVHLSFGVEGNDVVAVAEDISNFVTNTSPAGVKFSLSSRTVQGNGSGSSVLYLRYPRWAHGSSGFFIENAWDQVKLGPTSSTTFKVTKSCARMSVLSEDKQTEYALLYRY